VDRRTRTVVSALAATGALGIVTATAQAGYSIRRVGMELRLAGDDAGDVVVIDRTAAGAIRVDVGADGTFEYDGASTVADTTRIVVNAGGGNDQVALNEAMGALRRRLAKRHRLVRRPRITVANVATGDRTTARPRIRVKQRRR
jgi:hypothetical protein